MEDKEDPLDKFLVRNLQLTLERRPAKPWLRSQRGYCFRPAEGEPSAAAGQPPSGAGERQPGSETHLQQGGSERRSGQGGPMTSKALTLELSQVGWMIFHSLVQIVYPN